jgi:hypothetical protein
LLPPKLRNPRDFRGREGLPPGYIYVSDADLRVVYVNKTAADYLGLSFRTRTK